MPDIRIHRPHALGLEAARRVAERWADEARTQFDLACTVLVGETSDTVRFTRSGVNGELIVAADHFDLTARLGLLLGPFSQTIRSEIEKNLDALLAAPPAAAPRVRRRKSG